MHVATVLTVYGIETVIKPIGLNTIPFVATVLTVYGIETIRIDIILFVDIEVATVLTVYGIETTHDPILSDRHHFSLQQYLPFTVLKLKLSFLVYWSHRVRCNSTYRLRY